MITNIEIEIAPIDEAVDALKDKINDFFLKDVDDKFLSPHIETELATLIETFKDELWCVIDYPYVDKVFRDSYYNYYSSKHHTYQRDCIRVSLFDKQISQDHFLDPLNHGKLAISFLGFFVLRPTVNALFGRSMISPKAFKENNFLISSCKTSSLVYGVKLVVEGFPHCSQDGESIKCAETTIWALMEYFGNRYPEYKPALPAKINQALERFSYQRQLPSNGLTMDQISFALKEFGFGTRIYSQTSYGKELYDIIDSYIESGIPVIVGLQSNDIGHVIIAMGKRYEKFKWKDIDPTDLDFRNNKVQFYEATNIPAKYVVQDDNMMPYRLIALDNPGEHYEDKDCSDYEIDSVVVPLYPKIYLESVIAKELVFQVLGDDNIGYDFGSDFVFRFYLTSSRSFKNHIAKLPLMDKVLKNNMLLTKMPKFIWCAEFYTKEEFITSDRIANGLIVLDATQANQDSIDTLIFAGYPTHCISLNENNFVTLPTKFKKYSYFSNLK